ncbi:hypothetical protein [Elizabethkingia anophelis]|uniref:hypothetical protein n=1 Tax=Elizabethkingia anophelis TaxID=1117645 RepID=UPI001DC470CC|nr:hypothetical protein [Elizabethkingia anophelis]EHM7983023.1 hypothetical protein [Elizabethkingia anophelis]EHM8030245.1 hypothetical protein [Elizabethkingia anophelis]EHZ9532999.1 hypothetical protein [Elizabethkingia anophelis]EKU3670909.1 hypothetical protein [Elizabethkingia anophelis]EKW9476278.1 hypothetical protein [Elizabethkingia anophelis]
MIKVNKIEWLSKEAKEAEVYLSDDNFNIICFAHPFDKSIGDPITQPLYAFLYFEYKRSGQIIK